MVTWPLSTWHMHDIVFSLYYPNITFQSYGRRNMDCIWWQSISCRPSWLFGACRPRSKWNPGKQNRLISWLNGFLLIGNQNVGSNAGSLNVPLRWHGTCIHDFQTPKWVQKQRQVESETSEFEDIYQEPRRATCVAINIKFSLFAFGTHR